MRIDTIPSAGSLTLSGVAVTASQVITVADIMAGNLVFTPAADANGTGYATFTFSVRDSNNTYDAVPNTLTVNVTAVNDAPVISSLAGDTLPYTEGDGAVTIEQGFDSWVQDVDSANFDTGMLTVSIPSGGDSAEDVLSIRNQGTAGGQIGVSGSNVTFGGVTIGTFSGGISGSPLVVTLNSNATPLALDALVLNITYENTDTNAPTAGARTVRFTLTDGDGGTSANYDTTVTVSAVNDAPVITPIAPDVTFVEGGLPQVFDATGTIVDVDSTNFDGGTLTVSISANGTVDDRLQVGNFGTGPGQVGLSGSNVTYGGTVVGTVSGGGSGSDPLVITFNTSATPTAVQEVYRSIQFTNVSDDPSTATRTLTIGLTDGDGGTTTPQTKLVYVQATNDVPTDLSLSANTVVENAANGTMVGTVSGTDPDSGDTKTYSFTDSAGGRFAINSSTGQITVADSSLLDYESATNHSVTVRVTDAGGLTYDETFTINLTNVNEAPTGADATVTINEDTSHTLTTANFGFSDVDAGDSLSAVRIDTIPTAGTLTLSGVPVTAGQVISVANITAGNLVFTPTANASGTGYASFTFSVRDSNNAYDAAPNTLTVNVTAVNDAPVLSANTGSTVAEGETNTIDASELAVTDVEQAAAQLAYSIGTGPAYGRLELTTAPGLSATTFTQADIAANRLVYVHDGSETTSDSFTFTVSDGAGGTLGTTTMTLTITPVNDTPTITSNGGASTAAINVAENVSAVTIVTGADVDLPAQALTYNISGGADQALFTINAATGALNFAAPPDFEAATDANGDNVYVVQVQVIDSQGASTTQTIQVTVTDAAEGLPPAPTTPAVPPILLSPTSSPGSAGSDPVPSSPSRPAESPTDALPQSPVSSGSRSVPEGFQSTTAVPFTTESLTERTSIPLSDQPRKPINIDKDQSGFIVNDEVVRPLFTVLPVEPAPDLEPEPPEVRGSVSDLLLAKLDEMAVSLEQTIGVSEEQHALVTRITALTGTTLSVGFIVWALRSGTLLASFMATMPAWRHFDPLPVLGGSRSERDRRRKEAERDQQAEATEFKGLKHLLDLGPPLDPKP